MRFAALGKAAIWCGLTVITRSRIKKATPTSNLSALNGEDVDPFGFKQLLSIHGRCFFPAQYGDVLASLDELPWLKGVDIVCLRKRLKKFGHLLRGSPSSGVRQSRWSDTLPIDFVSDQVHEGRNITPGESRISFLNDIKCCTHG